MPQDYDFGEYLRQEGNPNRAARLALGEELINELRQKAKNASAPTVGGNSYNTSGNGGGGTYSGAINLKGLAGGKGLPTGARISQGWGKSRIKYAAGRHTGMDFGGKANSSIKAAMSGVVVRAGREGAYGNAIHVKQKDGTYALYAHLNGINVKPGQRVNIGQQIGRMGSTGRSTGTHLHFEVRKQDKYGGDINPASWFSSR